MSIAILRNFRVPNLCKNTSVLLTVLIGLSLALILSLLHSGPFSWEYFSLSAIYLIWLFLGSITLLCLGRKMINQTKQVYGLLISVGIYLLVFVIIELIFYVLLPAPGDVISGGVLRRGLASLCFALLVVSFFSVLHTLDLGAKSESQARLQALQSRIHPHFLFNSLNTISELVSLAPNRAEQAIESLSELFRASFDDADQHTLQQELDLCRQYLSLEKLRLEDRLTVVETIELKHSSTLFVPRLILQPLLENAVLHGAAGLASGGNIKLDIREAGNYLSIKVSNSKAKKAVRSGGAGLALDNIRERLFVLYDDDHYFKIRDESERFSVIMRLPKKTAPLT